MKQKKMTNSQKRNLRYQKRKIFFYVLAIICLVSFSIISLFTYQVQLREKVIEQTQTTVEQYADYSVEVLSNMLAEYRSQIDYLTYYLDNTASVDWDVLNSMLGAKNSGNQYACLGVCDSTGELYNGIDTPTDVSEELYFKRAYEDQECVEDILSIPSRTSDREQVTVTPEIPSTTEMESFRAKDVQLSIDDLQSEDTTNAVILATPVLQDQSVAYVIVVTYQIDDFLNSVGGEQFADMGNLQLMKDNGEIISNTQTSETYESYEDVLDHMQFKDGPSKEQFLEEGLNSDRYFIYNQNRLDAGCIYMVSTDLDGWKFVFQINSNYLEDSYQNIQMSTYLLGLINLLIAGGILFCLYEMYQTSRVILTSNHLDPFSGLYNKSAAKHLSEEYFKKEKGLAKSACFFIDLDRFKSINDTYGHDIGDQVIKEFGILLKDLFRKTDIVSRFGGDEFFILMKDCGDEESASQKAQEIIKAFESIEHYNSGTSIGIALYPQHGEEYDVLLKHADEALYESKSNGRNTYTIYHGQEEAIVK